MSAEGIEGMQKAKMAKSKAKESKERSSKPEEREEGEGASVGEDSGEWLDMDRPLGKKQWQSDSKPMRLRYCVKCKPKEVRISRKI
jgi:hypothetical protein